MGCFAQASVRDTKCLGNTPGCARGALLAVHRRALHHIHPRVWGAADRPVPAVLSGAVQRLPIRCLARHKQKGSLGCRSGSTSRKLEPFAPLCASIESVQEPETHVYPVEHAPRVEVLIVLSDRRVALHQAAHQNVASRHGQVLAGIEPYVAWSRTFCAAFGRRLRTRSRMCPNRKKKAQLPRTTAHA